MTTQIGLKLLSLCFATEPRNKQCKEYIKIKDPQRCIAARVRDDGIVEDMSALRAVESW